MRPLKPNRIIHDRGRPAYSGAAISIRSATSARNQHEEHGTMSDTLTIVDALYWSLNRNAHPNAYKLTSARSADIVVAAATAAICCQNAEYDSPDAYRRLSIQVKAMLPKVHEMWRSDWSDSESSRCRHMA
jgi:hypothetical protein